MPASYPENPISIGEHIKKKRMDMKLLQRDVCDILKVDEFTIGNWENNNHVPQIKFLPRIIKFLGYLPPLEVDTSTFAGKLIAYRYEHGLSQKHLAKILNVDPSTISSWETEANLPQDKLIRQELEVLLRTNLPNSKKPKEPKKVLYPENPVTLGEHIKKKRMELKLFQADVAKLMKVGDHRIGDWENNISSPHIKFFPQIIEFLGYFPFEIDNSKLSGKIKEYRYRNGLTGEQFGNIFGIYKNEVYRWESGEKLPEGKTLKKLRQLIASKPGH